MQRDDSKADTARADIGPHDTADNGRRFDESSPIVDDGATAFALPVMTLWWREIVRFVRQRSRVVSALGTPVVFWLLLGSGFGQTFSTGVAASAGGTKVDYLHYFFAGTLVLIVLFTAIFSTISVIEDRREGFLQGVLVAPVHRLAIVLGKVLGSTTLAVGQAMLFLALAPPSGIPLSLATVAGTVGVLTLVALGLSGLGLLLAWSMDSTQGFHAIMNLFLLPMWLLSGALFPKSGASVWIQWIMTINPLTYGVDAVRFVLAPGDVAGSGSTSSLPLSISLIGAFAVATILLSARAASKRSV